MALPTVIEPSPESLGWLTDASLVQYRLVKRFASVLERFEEEHFWRSETGTRYEVGVQIVYLIDFQEIHNYVAPFLTRSRRSRGGIRREHIIARDFFERLEEPFLLSLGTGAELERFVDTIARDVRRLATGLRAIDTDLQALANYLENERFLTDPNVDPDPVSPTIRVLRDLSALETGLERLLALLTHPRRETIGTLLPGRLLALDRRIYDNARRSLDAIRHHPEYSFNNKADAYNLALACTINDRVVEVLEKGSAVPPRFVRILTDTPSVYRAISAPVQQYEYTAYAGHRLHLLEGIEEALWSRALRRRYGEANFDDFLALQAKTDNAARALSALRHRAAQSKLSMGGLIQKLQAPASRSDRMLMVELQESIEALTDFWQKQQELDAAHTPRLIRADMLPGGDLEEETPLTMDVTRLQYLIESVRHLVQSIDHLGGSIEPYQEPIQLVSASWQPVLSLAAYGYEVVRRAGELDSTCWEVRRSKEVEDPALTVDVYPDSLVSIYWTTRLTASAFCCELAETLKKHLPQLRILTVLVMSTSGEKEHLSGLAPAELATFSGLRDASMVRVQANGMAVVVETYVGAVSYPPVTGVISRSPHIHFVTSLFGATGHHTILPQLLYKELWEPLGFSGGTQAVGGANATGER